MSRLDSHFWWYLARGSGMVAWVLAGGSCALGTLFATRILKPYDRPAWLLALHRHLSALFIALTVTHLTALVLDSYVSFSWRELLVPMASSWRPLAVAYGVIALYLAVLVEVSSLARRRLPKRLWHGTHLLSYVSFLGITAHAIAAGSDVRNSGFVVLASVVVSLFAFMSGVKVLTLRGARTRRVQPNRPSGN